MGIRESKRFEEIRQHEPLCTIDGGGKRATLTAGKSTAHAGLESKLVEGHV
jgi:hypothetical protein